MAGSSQRPAAAGRAAVALWPDPRHLNVRVWRWGHSAWLTQAETRPLIPRSVTMAMTCGSWGSTGRCSYSGWNRAIVFPSGSLNHADRPSPGVVAMWSTVLSIGKS